MPNDAELTFSNAELVVLADVHGSAFPGLDAGSAPDAGVRDELLARGMLVDRDDGTRAVRDPEGAAIECALTGDAVTLAASDAACVCLVRFFITRSAVVRHEDDGAGRHTLRNSSVDAIAEHLARIAGAMGDADGAPVAAADPRSDTPATGASAGVDGTVRAGYEQVVEAVRIGALGDVTGAHALLPDAAGYLDAMSGARLLATVESLRRRGDETHVSSLSVVDGGAHGSWLLSADTGIDDEVTIERVSQSGLARRLAALLEDVVASPPAAVQGTDP